MKSPKELRNFPRYIEWYEVENTGWSGGLSWFGTGGDRYLSSRFDTPEEAIEYINNTHWGDDSIKWRYVHITLERFDNKEILTKEWTDYDVQNASQISRNR